MHSTWLSRSSYPGCEVSRPFVSLPSPSDYLRLGYVSSTLHPHLREKSHRLSEMFLFYFLLACLIKSWVREVFGIKWQNKTKLFQLELTFKHLVKRDPKFPATLATLKGPPFQ